MNTNTYNNTLLDQYNYLMETYIDTIIELIDISYSLRILPFKVMFGLNWIKNHIKTNKLEVLDNGINYLLLNKDLVLNFSIDKLDELDEDFDDNVSIKSCLSNFKKIQKENNITNIISDSDDMLNLIIEIKNNTKKLCQEDISIIKSYFELLIIILEKIQNLFNNSKLC